MQICIRMHTHAHICTYMCYVYTCMYVCTCLIGAPIIGMITVTEGCRYLYVSWMYNSNACGDVTYTVTLTSATMNMDITRSTTTNSLNITDSKLTYGTFNVTIEGNNTIGSGSNSTLASTPMLVGQYVYVHSFTYVHAYNICMCINILVCMYVCMLHRV